MKVMEVALAIIWRGGRLFLQRRDPAGPVLPGRWEFPGGKVEAGETPAETLRRELLEEVALAPEDLRALSVVEHAYPDRRVRLHPFQMRATDGLHTALAWGWFTPEEALRLPVPDANHALIRGLRAPAGDDPE